MKTIFKNIEGREWDNFDMGESINLTYDTLNMYSISLADLLANKSWCRAVWGDEVDSGEVNEHIVCSGKNTCVGARKYNSYMDDSEWEGVKIDWNFCKVCGSKMVTKKIPIMHFDNCGTNSQQAFQILQQEGEEACIKYIKETMV